MAKQKRRKFDYDQDFKTLDFRVQPEKYQVGIGEQGVLLVEPYKSEILPHWRFKTPEIALESSQKIYQIFLEYKKQSDFAGMDMARKFLQMGYTRARRYANHPGGRKYDKKSGAELPGDLDVEKAESAAIFYEKYVKAREDPKYQNLKKAHVEKYEMEEVS